MVYVLTQRQGVQLLLFICLFSGGCISLTQMMSVRAGAGGVDLLSLVLLLVTYGGWLGVLTLAPGRAIRGFRRIVIRQPTDRRKDVALLVGGVISLLAFLVVLDRVVEATAAHVANGRLPGGESYRQ